MTHYLKFPDKKTCMAAMEGAGFVLTDKDGSKTVVNASHSHALDVVGDIYRGAEYDLEGNRIAEQTKIPGWHVNYIGDLPAGWDQYLVTPQHPARVFA